MKLLSALLVAGLGLVALTATYALVLAPRRSAEFAAAVPVLPPDLRVVLLARSPDGERWTLDRTVVAEPADTPDLLQRDGHTLLYFLDGVHDVLVVQDLGSGQQQTLDLGEACDWEAGYTCVDPAAVVLDDGGVRLFFVQSPRGTDPALHGMTRILSARSDDGLSFRLDPRPALADRGRVDPDPVRLSDGRIRLYTTRLHDEPGSLPDMVVESAVSDGQGTFSQEPGVRLRNASATRTVQTGSGYRSWFHDIDGRLRVADSPDGLSFRPRREAVMGPDIPDSRFFGIEAPGLARTADGWLMAVSTAREPWWPFNERVAREALQGAPP